MANRTAFTGINIEHRWTLALKQFGTASALIMQGNLLVGVIDDTSDGYLAVPIKIRAIARYEKGGPGEEKAYQFIDRTTWEALVRSCYPELAETLINTAIAELNLPEDN